MSICNNIRPFVTSNRPGSGGILTTTSKVIYSEEYFVRSSDGLTQSSSRNINLVNNGPGQWTVNLTTPHPDGVNYHPSITVEEQDSNRDSVIPQIVQGSQTASSFDLMLLTGDNGGNADGYVISPFSISISSPISVIETVTLL